MKKLSIVLIVTMMLGLGVVIAQTSSTDATQNSNAAIKGSTTLQKPAICTGEGRGYGDGTKPRPRDGTGFGAKSGNRQKRNAALGQGKSNGLKNGLGKHQCLNSCQADCQKTGPGRGNGMRLQQRFGSGQCKTTTVASDTSTAK